MTSLELLQSVYGKGERCLWCEYCYYQIERDRLSGRATVAARVRCCDIVASQEYMIAREPWDCPGVEDELNKGRR